MLPMTVGSINNIFLRTLKQSHVEFSCHVRVCIPGKDERCYSRGNQEDQGSGCSKESEHSNFFPLSFKVNNTFLLLKPWRLYSTREFV